MRRISLAAFAFALGGCAHTPIEQSATHLKPAEPAPSGSIPAPVQFSTVLPEPKPTLRPETYTVVVNGVRVQELLFALARDAKLNVDIHSGITGTVTLNAIDQTLPQLLSRIARQVDMRWELDGPNLAVMPDSPYLHIYGSTTSAWARLVAGAVGVSSQIDGISGSERWLRRGSSGRPGSITTVRNTSDNKFWATLERTSETSCTRPTRYFPAAEPRRRFLRHPPGRLARPPEVPRRPPPTLPSGRRLR